MKILITGGKGFIGSRIVEELSKDNQVTVLDNSDGYGIVDKEELNKLYKWRQRNWGDVHVLDGDVTDRMACLRAFNNRPDIVIHLAAYPRAKL